MKILLINLAVFIFYIFFTIDIVPFFIGHDEYGLQQLGIGFLLILTHFIILIILGIIRIIKSK